MFIKGGSGTGGFLEGGADEQLSSITDYSTKGRNHGWGQLADVLKKEEFILEQKVEGSTNNNTPVDLINIDLKQYSVLVFGSNNANYSVEAVDSVLKYIENGGGALFISDANWGQNWGDAPGSDQPFLTPIGWTMNQDNGTYTLYSSNFKVKDHFIVQGVNSFDGEGVSPISLTNSNISGVKSTILTPAKNQVRRNTGYTKGPTQSVTSKDASCIVAEVGKGRIAGHFDRNTFFNTNGAGSNLHKNSNKQYAINLFSWLAGKHLSTSRLTNPGNNRITLIKNTAVNVIRLKGQVLRNQIEVFDIQGRRINFRLSSNDKQIEIYPEMTNSSILLLKISTNNKLEIFKVLYQR